MLGGEGGGVRLVALVRSVDTPAELEPPLWGYNTARLGRADEGRPPLLFVLLSERETIEREVSNI